MVEVLNRLIGWENKDKFLTGAKVISMHFITYLLFVDDILLFGNGCIEEWKYFHDIISLFCDASGMEVNIHKSCFFQNVVDENALAQIHLFLPYKLESRFSSRWIQIFGVIS